DLVLLAVETGDANRQTGADPAAQPQHALHVHLPSQARVVVVEAELVFGDVEAALDCPAMALHLHQRLDGCTGRSPRGEEGEIAIGDVVAYQQTAGPDAGERNRLSRPSADRAPGR